MTRGLQVLLCLLLVLTGSPALAHCRPENRVWGFSEKPADFESYKNANPIAASGENPGCGYDFASGVHKYLYCQNNPVNMTDPSGHDGDIASLDFSMSMMAGMAAFTGAAVLEAKTHAIGNLTQAVATAAIADGESAIDTAKSALSAAGKSLRQCIEDAKQILGRLRDDPIKVIPMPACVIPAVASHVAAAQGSGMPGLTTPLTRVTISQALINRVDALKGMLPAGVDLSGKVWSLDEYPFASSRQGGIGASVAAVPLWQNCVQGGIIGACYGLEKITPGTQYYVVVTP